MAHTPEEINDAFRVHGWTVVKALEVLDLNYLSEDLAQFQKGSLVVDFGFYGNGADIASGVFKILLIEGEDWECCLAAFECRKPDIAYQFLRSFAEY